MEDSAKKYEISFLSVQEAGGDEINRLLEGNGAIISVSSAVNRIKLAYPIEKEAFAYFGYVIFSADPENIKKIKEGIKFMKGILRTMVIVNPIVALRSEAPSEGAVQPEALIETEKGEVSSSASEEVSRPKKTRPVSDLSNEELEKKLEEILK